MGNKASLELRKASARRTPSRLQRMLQARKLTCASVARVAGVSRQRAWNVVALGEKSPKIEQAVAELLGETVEELFPYRRKVEDEKIRAKKSARKNEAAHEKTG